MTPLPELNSLPREMPPPPELEPRVVAALRAQALVKPGTRVSWMQVAAAILLLTVGGLIGRGFPTPPVQRAVNAPRFLFLLSDADTAGDDAARAEAYRQWAVAAA